MKKSNLIVQNSELIKVDTVTIVITDKSGIQMV